MTNTPQLLARRGRFRNYMVKEPEFISYMTTNIEIFSNANWNPSSHANIWEALKGYMRGHVLSYSATKQKKNGETQAKLERTA